MASEAGEGSTFAFYIKGRRAVAAARASDTQRKRLSDSGYSASPKNQRLDQFNAANHSVNASTTKETGEGKVAKKLIVLLVEDNLVNQKVLSKQLRRVGCTVHVANHGQEALEILQKTKLWRNSTTGDDIDIVLMDLEMPIMDGLTCARRIRGLQSEGSILRHVPIIAVTANARMEQIETAITAGMVGPSTHPPQGSKAHWGLRSFLGVS